MTLFACGSAEERHTSGGYAVGLWNGISSVTITLSEKDSGNAGYQLSSTTAGSSPTSTYGSKCWWSFASLPWTRSGGSHAYMFLVIVGASSATRYIGWYWNSVDTKYYLALFSDGAGTRVATSSTGILLPAWKQFKLEFDNNAWTLWSNISGSWQSEFTYTDSLTGPYTFQISLNGSSNDTKSSTWATTDNVLAWDSAGGDWNSRLDAGGTVPEPNNKFPQVSVAHYPTADNSISGLEWQDIDEVTPDHAQSAGETKAGYLATIEDLKSTPEDYTTKTIQAVMVTHTAGTAPNSDTIAIFNCKENGHEYLDSARPHTQTDAAQRKCVQIGSHPTGPWATYAGYYPWTPEGNLWTQTNFNACEFGFSLIDGKSDQLTVQVVYFGSAAEWKPIAARQRIIQQAVNRAASF